MCPLILLFYSLFKISMPELEATTEAEVNEFLKNNGGVAVVDCYATYFYIYPRWCGPCKAIAPYVSQKTTAEGVPLVKVDVDKSQALSALYNIEAMPTFLVIQNTAGNVVDRVVGGGQGNVDKVVKKSLELKA